jgi:hypothetical protein
MEKYWVSFASSSGTFRKISGRDEWYCNAAVTAELKKKKATVGADDQRWHYYATLLEALG